MQNMEKITIKSSRGIKLAAAFYPNNTDKAIIICHGFTSNKDRERHKQNAESLHKAGFAVIRFDFGGCGESEEAPIVIGGQVQDLKSVIKFLNNKEYKKIAIVGESVGGLIDVKGYTNEIVTMVLWAPVTDKKDQRLEEFIIKKNEKVKEYNGNFIVYKKDGRKHTIPKEYFEERASVNQEEICRRVKCPVLIIHGNQDATVPLEMSKRAIKFFSNDSKLEVLEGISHRFNGHEKELIKPTVKWMKEHF